MSIELKGLRLVNDELLELLDQGVTTPETFQTFYWTRVNPKWNWDAEDNERRARQRMLISKVVSHLYELSEPQVEHADAPALIDSIYKDARAFGWRPPTPKRESSVSGLPVSPAVAARRPASSSSTLNTARPAGTPAPATATNRRRPAYIQSFTQARIPRPAARSNEVAPTTPGLTVGEIEPAEQPDAPGRGANHDNEPDDEGLFYTPRCDRCRKRDIQCAKRPGKYACQPCNKSKTQCSKANKRDKKDKGKKKKKGEDKDNEDEEEKENTDDDEVDEEEDQFPSLAATSVLHTPSTAATSAAAAAAAHHATSIDEANELTRRTRDLRSLENRMNEHGKKLRQLSARLRSVNVTSEGDHPTSATVPTPTAGPSRRLPTEQMPSPASSQEAFDDSVDLPVPGISTRSNKRKASVSEDSGINAKKIHSGRP
ncbi:hypothetical protein DXG01_004437 [Tephrocybe rancida]|nr:hypothetical protein DXG01_004437 [Tephrocybe rancida]